MLQSPECYPLDADKESAYCLNAVAIKSACYDDIIAENMSQPGSNFRLPARVASPRKLWLILSSVIAISVTLTGGYSARGANRIKPASQTTLPVSSSPSRNIAHSHNISSTSRTPVADAADDGWPLPPLMGGDWVALDQQASRKMIERLVKHVTSDSDSDWLEAWARQITQFRTIQLSFYPGAILCEGLVLDAGFGEAGIFSFILLKDGTVTLLNGESPSIHELNAKVPIAISTREQIESYLRFFTASIFAKSGNFRIVDTVEDPIWARDAAESDKRRAAKYIRPLALDKLNDGRWKANATMQYSTSLFSAILHISPTGMIYMAEDVPVASDLPLRREAFSGALRYEIQIYK